MYLIFYKTNDVFEAEEKLQAAGIPTKIVPTPVQDKAYCGVCVRVKDADREAAKELLKDMEYQVS